MSPSRTNAPVVVRIDGVKLPSLNRGSGQGHWRYAWAAARSVKNVVGWQVRAALFPAYARRLLEHGCIVRIVRLSSGTLDDDNAVGSAKAVRDAVAAVFGVDDRDPRIEWRVSQEKTKRGVFGVRIEIHPR